MKIIDGVIVFTLTPVGKEGSDCTRPYDVTLRDAVTVEELIRAIAEGVDEYGRTEWGYIGIYEKGYFPFIDERCEYRDGKVISNNIPDEILHKEVISVKASGGWSRMDYCLTVKGD